MDFAVCMRPLGGGPVAPGMSCNTASHTSPVYKHSATPQSRNLRCKVSRKSWVIALLEHQHRTFSGALWVHCKLWCHLGLPGCERMQHDAGNFPLMAEYYGDTCIKTRRQYLVDFFPLHDCKAAFVSWHTACMECTILTWSSVCLVAWAAIHPCRFTWMQEVRKVCVLTQICNAGEAV